MQDHLGSRCLANGDTNSYPCYQLNLSKICQQASKQNFMIFFFNLFISKNHAIYFNKKNSCSKTPAALVQEIAAMKLKRGGELNSKIINLLSASFSKARLPFAKRWNSRSARDPHGTYARIRSNYLGQCEVHRQDRNVIWGSNRILLKIPGQGFYTRIKKIDFKNQFEFL